MRIAVFGAKPYDRATFEEANARHGHDLVFLGPNLTPAAIEALTSGRIGYLGLDLYEEEAGVFLEDGSGRTLLDDVLARLLTFPNVLITGHQAFLAREALANIAETTLGNVSAFERIERSGNEVAADG